MMMHVPPHIAIMVTTFRRPASLSHTLESLAQQRLSNASMTLHIIDNDADPAVEALVSRFRNRSGMAVAYHAEPKQGIASARNHALDLVTGETDYIAFIDDDEVASPLWLESLLRTALQFNARIVQGPVEPVYEEAPPLWFREGRFTALGPFREGAELRFGFSGNVLLSAQLVRASGLRFETCFDRSGGEDQHFFMLMMANGERIITSRDAIVFEVIPPSRVGFGDFLRRRFRIGATLTMAWKLIRNDGHIVFKRMAVGAGHACWGALQCLLPWHWSASQLAADIGRMVYGIGQIAGATGWSIPSYQSIHTSGLDRKGS